MARRQARYLMLAETLSAASVPFHDCPLHILTRGSLVFTAGLIAKGLLRGRRSKERQAALILHASELLIKSIVQFLEMYARDQETARVLGEAEAILREPQRAPTARLTLEQIEHHVLGKLEATKPYGLIMATVATQLGVTRGEVRTAVALLAQRGLVCCGARGYVRLSACTEEWSE